MSIGDNCPFCPINWGKLNILDHCVGDATAPEMILFVSLQPVVAGHVLVASARHSTDAADNPMIAADLMEFAASWVANQGIQANIITSIGRDATQTVFHTHLHVVPRKAGDGLMLPWGSSDVH